MDFETWLAQASEEDLRVASTFTWHYPTTIKVYQEIYLSDEPEIRHVCGCNPGFSHTFGEGKHVPDLQLAIMCVIFERALQQET